MDRFINIEASSLRRLSAARRAIRPHEWLKNLLVFLPAIAAHRIVEVGVLFTSSVAFVSFSCAASAAYLINDLADRENDRRHPTKRFRPFASGELSAPEGITLCAVMLLVSLLSSFFLPPGFREMVVGYILLTTLYSFLLRKFALIDIAALTAFYLLRIIGGGEAAGIDPSFWLLGSSLFLFLSLASAKRFGELVKARAAGTHNEGDRRVHGRGYGPDDLEPIRSIGMGSGLVATLVLAIYAGSESARELYRAPGLLWVLCLLLAYWVWRLWSLAGKGKIPDELVLFVVRDRISCAALAVSVAIFLLAKGLPWVV